MAGAGTTTQVGGLSGGGGGGGTYLEILNNLSDLNSVSTARTNLGFSTLTDYVTLTGTQTLTNKTLTSPTVTSLTGTGTTTITGTTNINPTGVSALTIGNSAGSTAIDFISRQSPTSTVYTTSTTASIENFALYTKSSSGTPATGYGGKLNFYADTNGNTNRNSGYLGISWSTATDASRTAYAEFRLVNNASLIQTVDIVPGGLNIYGTTNGVVSVRTAAAAGTWTLTLPTTDGNANEFLQTNGSGVSTWAVVTDALLSTSDITTNNVSTTKHGFAPKAPNDATKYLDGTGAYSVPAGGGGGGQAAIVKSGSESSNQAQTRYGGGIATSNLILLTGYTNVLRYDGSTWTTTAHGGAATSMGTLAVNGDVVCLVGTGTTGRRSTDGGATWGNITAGFASTNPLCMINSGNTWIYTVSNAQTTAQRSSDNGATWGNITIHGSSVGSRGVSTDGAGNWQALTGSTATRYSTDDGATWAAGTALAGTPKCALYANGYFWALLDTSKQLAYTSTANGSWTYLITPGISGTNTNNGWWYGNSKMYFVDGEFNLWSCADPTQSTAEWALEGVWPLLNSNQNPQAYYYNGHFYGTNTDVAVYQVLKL